jgi:hypothetical protein
MLDDLEASLRQELGKRAGRDAETGGFICVFAPHMFPECLRSLLMQRFGRYRGVIEADLALRCGHGSQSCQRMIDLLRQKDNT